MRICKLFDFSSLKFANVGYECIFHEIHFLIAIDDETIGIYTQQIFGGEIELQLVIVFSFEDGLGRQPVLTFVWLICTYSHFKSIL
jgi:hypothetical protein